MHFALVYDGNRSICYANGVSVSAADRVLDTSVTNPFQIGCYGWQVNYFDGLIDDVRLYGKALTPAEVQVVYSRADPVQAWGAKPSVAPSPTHCWPCRSRGSRAMASSSTMSTSPAIPT